MRYKIILYNAGKRVKKFGKFSLYAEAKSKFEELIQENKILFPKFYNYNGTKTDFELVLVGPPEGKHINHIKDEIGRKVVIKSATDATIKRIEEYQVEEAFLYKNINKKIKFKELIKKIILNKKGSKIYHSVKNKLVIEYVDSNHIDILVLKNQEDAIRLNDTIRDFYTVNNLVGMFFPFPDKSHVWALYDRIEHELGIPKTYMWRESTY